MRTGAALLAIVVTVAFASFVFGQAKPAAQPVGKAYTVNPAGMRVFEDVIDHLHPTKNTKLHVIEYWKNAPGQEMVSTATVINVLSGKGAGIVQAVNKSRPSSRGQNLQLTVPDVTRAAELKIGDVIVFKGALEKYKTARDGSTLLYLKGVEILEP